MRSQRQTVITYKDGSAFCSPAPKMAKLRRDDPPPTPEDQCTASRLAPLINGILNAAAPPSPAALAPLLHRPSFGIASGLLCAGFHDDHQANLLALLIVRPTPRLRAFCLARYFDLVPVYREKTPFTLADLRDSKHPEAATALACLGVIDWPSASRRTRQAFVIHCVARAWRSS